MQRLLAGQERAEHDKSFVARLWATVEHMGGTVLCPMLVNLNRVTSCNL